MHVNYKLHILSREWENKGQDRAQEQTRVGEESRLQRKLSELND